MNNKQFDIILFGATSFVGQIVAKQFQQLVDQRSPSLRVGFSWAMAGRSESKLAALKQSLGETAQNLPLIIADSHNQEQIHELCKQGRVIISTVGPYALYGETLVKVCAESGTDYCDLTGEPHWIKRMLDRYEETAKKNGARIVHCCGFDAIPSDLGVFYTQQQAIDKFGKPAPTIKMAVKSMKGTFSGGTIASGINLTKEIVADKNLRKQLANPYILCPEQHVFSERQPNYLTVYDQHFSSWMAPFIMAAINTRIVHRSNGLLNNLYGENFVYSENILTGKNGQWRSRFLRLGLSLFGFLTAVPPSRWLLQKFVLPKSGQGPSQQQQDEGFFDVRFVGLSEDGAMVKTKVTGDRDPGYGSTAKMLAQSALCLAFDLDSKQAGGIFTPASIMAKPLLDRLNSHAGVEFSVSQ